MGEAIFYHLNDFEYSLVWICREQELRDKAIEKYDKKLRRMHKTDVIDDETYTFKKDNTTITMDLEVLSNCDLIIEAIIEDLEIKSALFKQLDIIVDKNCIFVSNSSSIKPSRMCPDSERRDKFAGLHFFYPVRFSPIVEIIETNDCSPYISLF